jgi:hypothetical protein
MTAHIVVGQRIASHRAGMSVEGRPTQIRLRRPMPRLPSDPWPTRADYIQSASVEVASSEQSRQLYAACSAAASGRARQRS